MTTAMALVSRFLLLVAVLCFPTAAWAAEGKLHGDVVLEKGEELGYPAALQVWQGESMLARVDVGKGGTFGVALKGLGDGEVVIAPVNSGTGFGPKTVFYSGGTKLRPAADMNAKVKLQAWPAVSVTVTVKDPDGRPVGNCRASCVAVVEGPFGGLVPSWGARWGMQSDEKGLLLMWAVAAADVGYRLAVRIDDKEHSWLSGELIFKGLDVQDGKRAFDLTLKRGRTALIIKAKWDPKFTTNEFQPYENYGWLSHGMNLKGPSDIGCVLRDNGTVTIENVKPGKYEVTPDAQVAKYYVVTGNSEQFEMPEGGERPVVHTIYLLPVKTRKYTGIVKDKVSGRPVAGATVGVGPVKAETDGNGKFAFESIDNGTGPQADLDGGLNLNVERKEYVSASRPVKGITGDSVEIALLAIENLRQFHGQVLDETTGQPVVGAEVASPFEKAAADKDGRFAVRASEEKDSQVEIKVPGYYPLAVAVSGLGDGAVVKLRSLPELSGRVTVAGTKDPSIRCALMFFGAENTAATCDFKGAYSVRLAEGRYRAVFTQTVFPTGRNGQELPGEPLYVQVLEMTVQMPKEGMKKNFEVQPVVRVEVSLELTDKAMAVGKPTYAFALRPDDNRESSPSSLVKNNEVVIYVPAGKHKILVLGGRNQGAIVGEVQAEADKSPRIKGRIEKWATLGHDNTGGVLLKSDGEDAEPGKANDGAKNAKNPKGGVCG